MKVFEFEEGELKDELETLIDDALRAFVSDGMIEIGSLRQTVQSLGVQLANLQESVGSIHQLAVKMLDSADA